MKITIAKIHLGKIKTLRDELSTALNGLLKTNSELNRLAKRQESLKEEIAALEKSADFENSEEVQALGLKRIELEHVTAKLSQIPGLGVEQTTPVVNLMRQIGYTVTAALTPTVESYAVPIAELLRPFCPDENYAVYLARQTPAAISLTQVCSRQFGSFGFSLKIAQEAISRCDEVLSGELDWKFDPNTGK